MLLHSFQNGFLSPSSQASGESSTGMLDDQAAAAEESKQAMTHRQKSIGYRELSSAVQCKWVNTMSRTPKAVQKMKTLFLTKGLTLKVLVSQQQDKN